MSFKIYDESKGELAPVLMHDAARPFVVVEERCGPGMSGRIRRSCEGRYATRKAARDRVRFLESR